MPTTKTGCVTCVTVRHTLVTHPLTCDDQYFVPDDALTLRHTPTNNDSQTVNVQVRDLHTRTYPPVGGSASNPVTHPLTCTNTPCVTNRQNRHCFSHNGIRVRHQPSFGRARTRAPAHARPRVQARARPCQDPTGRTTP